MKAVKVFIRRTSIFLLTAVALAAAIPPAAHAAAPCSSVSCLWNYSGSTVPVSCVPGSGCPTGASQWLSNGKPVGMSCWFDDISWTGNYASNRWFFIMSVPLAGKWLVHSSYVYNQTVVGGC